jgi:hypothetical protein
VAGVSRECVLSDMQWPSVSYAVNQADIDTYITVAGDFLHELTR